MKLTHLSLLLIICAFLTSCATTDVDVNELARQLSAANDALGAYVRATK